MICGLLNCIENIMVNVLSLFDGISVGQLALKQMGIDYRYYSSEIDKTAMQVTQKHFPNTIQLGDVRKISYSDGKLYTENGVFVIPNIDLLIGGSPCFVANTKILTKNGYKNIQDIVQGELVLTHNGKWRKVLKVGASLAKTRKIKFNSGNTVETTDEHPFYTNIDNIIEWKDAKLLDANTKCAVVKILDRSDGEDISKWYIMGKIIANGKKEKNCFIVKVNCLEIEQFMYMLDKCNVDYDVNEHKKKYIFKIFSDKFNLNDANNIYTESDINIYGFLRGIGAEPNKIIKTSNYESALMLQSLITTVYSANCNILKTIGNDTYEVIYYDINQQSDLYLWRNVVDNKKTNKFKVVYNLEVEIDNSYTANNIVVHNCTNLSSSGNRLGLNGKESSLYYEFTRLINEINPKFYFLENVVMAKKWENVITSDLKTQPILIDSAFLSAQTRKRLYWANWDILPPENKNITTDLYINGYIGAMRGRRIKNGVRKDYDYNIPIKQYIESKSYNKSNCLTTVSKDNVVTSEFYDRQEATAVNYRFLTISEMEWLQTLPIDYVKGLSYNKATKAIGNSWTLEVIKHCFACNPLLGVNRE